ncbi:unnamed protein product [Lathyrus sativus]|nr:unnamed protein product [Lathyrus sativus]
MATEKEDMWLWKGGGESDFSVCCCYDLLLEDRSFQALDDVMDCAMKILWNAKIPSRIQIFIWIVLWDRIATKHQLSKRGVIEVSSGLLCGGCDNSVETSTHLFFGCEFANNVWSEIENWLGIEVIRCSTNAAFFISFENSLKKVCRSGG